MTSTTAPTFTIETVERRTRKGRMASLVFGSAGTPDVEGWFASITHPNGHIEVSQLDGETDWHIDATFGRSGLPGHVNGFGGRYLLTQVVIPEVAAALNEMVEAL